MNLLILGGGVFLGAAALSTALARGHHVTVFNRGRSRNAWPEGVELLSGDRSADLSALAGRRWDAVIDTCGYAPADVLRSAEALATSGRYLFVSSVSVYATTHQVPVREIDPLASSDGIARDDRDLQHYGPQKAACEAEVQRVFGERALIVRPGLIVGPGDRSGRFSHWPWRVLEGGTMLVPDVPAREPLQFIDVRDLGDWMVALLEQGASGVFNATGPVLAPVCDWHALVDACAAEVTARGATPARAVRVSEAFLVEHGVQPWSELPLWLPSDDAGYRGFSRVDLGRAVATGLRTRALRDTIAAVMDEGVPAPDDKRRAGKLTREREAELLATWTSTPPNAP
ncbi:MAG: NAD-dependent epimerase/dehydratase family protein [Burkholderiales bacterium]